METPAQKTKLFNTKFLALLAVNLMMSISFSMVYTTISSYVRGLGYTVAIAGAVAGAFNITSMIMRPLSGIVSDRFNRKKLLIVSTAAMGFSIFGYGIFEDANILIAIRVIHGIAFAISTTVNMAMIPGIVPENRIGEGICYFALSQSLASALGPSLGLTIANASSLKVTFFVSAVIGVTAAAIAIPFPLADDLPKRDRKGLKLTDIIVPRCLPFTMIEVTIAAVSGLESSMLALYAASVGIANIGWYFTISAVTVSISRLFMGKLIDRKGTFAMYPGIAMMIIGLILLWKQSALWMFAAAGVIKTLGASLAKPALQAASVKSVGPDRRGAAVSTYYIGTDLGQGIAPMIAGSSVDMNGGDYSMPFGLFAIPLAISSGLYFLMNLLGLQRKAK